MAGGIFLRNTSQQENDVGQDQFSNAACIRKWRIKYRNTECFRRLGINLVGTNTKAPDGDQLLSIVQDFSIKLSARSNANEMRILNSLAQRIPRQGSVMHCNIVIAVTLQTIDSALVNAF